MSKPLLASVLIVLGILLLVLGQQRRRSLGGVAQNFGQSVATAVDGKARIPDHTLYFISGGVLIAIGVIVAVKRPS